MTDPKAREIIQRHVDCRKDGCKICLEDWSNLVSYIEKKTGDNSVDHGGIYCDYLKRKGIEFQTEFGWGTQECFKRENVDAYIASRNQKPAERKRNE